MNNLYISIKAINDYSDFNNKLNLQKNIYDIDINKINNKFLKEMKIII